MTTLIALVLALTSPAPLATTVRLKPSVVSRTETTYTGIAHVRARIAGRWYEGESRQGGKIVEFVRSRVMVIVRMADDSPAEIVAISQRKWPTYVKVVFGAS